MSIPGLDEWLGTPQGRYVADWEQRRLDDAVADVFGFNAIQIGMPQCDFLRANRIPLRVRASCCDLPVDVRCDAMALPFATQSVDLVVLPHLLEFHPDPHQLLREIERILMPEGKLIIVGFNPLSLWGLRKRTVRARADFPWNGEYLSLIRLKDWLKLLGFDIDRGAFGCYAPPFEREHWLQRAGFLEQAGDRWWGFAGGVYLVRAVKRVQGIRLIEPNWKRLRLARQTLRPVAERERLQ